MTEYMPWVLSAFTCANIWLVGSKRREGFVVGMAAQPLWLAFDWHVGAYGLMPLAIVLGWLYVRGWLKWSEKKLLVAIESESTVVNLHMPEVEARP